jgi:hypothetical protein
LGLLGQLLRLLRGLCFLRRLLAQLLRPLHRLLAQLLRLLRHLGSNLLRLLDDLGAGLRLGGGATAYLPSLVLATIRGRDLSAQRIDRVADNAARLLVQGNRDTIPGPRPPVPSTTEPQHQQHECQGPHRLAPVRLRHLRRLLGSPHTDLLRLLDRLSTNLRSLLRRLAAQLCGLRRRVSTDLLMSNPSAWAVAQACAREAVAVAQAAGITLDVGDPIEHVRALGGTIPHARPSMLLDLNLKRRGEVDAIIGQVAVLGEKYGVPTPVTRTVADIIRAQESSYL